jgi:hypothetical protein
VLGHLTGWIEVTGFITRSVSRDPILTCVGFSTPILDHFCRIVVSAIDGIMTSDFRAS